jgi:hypothetical protein
MLLMRKGRELEVRRRRLLMMAILGRAVLKIRRRLWKLVLLLSLRSNGLLILPSRSRAEHAPHKMLQPCPRDLDAGIPTVFATRATLKDGLMAIATDIAEAKSGDI